MVVVTTVEVARHTELPIVHATSFLCLVEQNFSGSGELELLYHTADGKLELGVRLCVRPCGSPSHLRKN